MFLLPTSIFILAGGAVMWRDDMVEGWRYDVACYKDTQPECKSSNNYECVTAT